MKTKLIFLSSLVLAFMAGCEKNPTTESDLITVTKVPVPGVIVPPPVTESFYWVDDVLIPYIPVTLS
jgi:hypothetical protein